ncbi:MULTISPECIES: hypothetical protein [unclassified Pseudovibrio]|uniref:hypothetical protein n=1 Tax=unclassified Pseudovibrio TaxID=2627060 RepID=UPI0007AE9DF3|nr:MULTISPECIES: hypothetical protein [unclassified Pseudovibrio]KZK92410.1 hypothetical protein PsW74_05693 [Pseudovibrio sp. W74]KZL10994.1 hypothetical protein PsAD14_01125 [Pseudovibrio sp. Ad14]
MADFTVEAHKIKVSSNIFNRLAKVFRDIFFSMKSGSERLDARDLPAHLQKDIGVNLELGPNVR